MERVPGSWRGLQTCTAGGERVWLRLLADFVRLESIPSIAIAIHVNTRKGESLCHIHIFLNS